MPDYQLPDGAVERGSRLVLEFYADELADHIGSLYRIEGLSPQNLDLYKQEVREAARLLRSAARRLREHAVFPVAVVHSPARPGFWSRLVGRVFPVMLLAAAAASGFVAAAFSR
jgi:hypothetical protein